MQKGRGEAEKRTTDNLTIQTAKCAGDSATEADLSSREFRRGKLSATNLSSAGEIGAFFRKKRGIIPPGATASGNVRRETARDVTYDARSEAPCNPTVLPSTKSHKTFGPPPPFYLYFSPAKHHTPYFCERPTDPSQVKRCRGDREREADRNPQTLGPPVERDLEAVFRDLSSPLRPRRAG